MGLGELRPSGSLSSHPHGWVLSLGWFPVGTDLISLGCLSKVSAPAHPVQLMRRKNWAVRCLSLWWSKRWQTGRAWLGMGTPNLDINCTADKSSVALYSVNPYIRSLENIMQPVSPTGPWVSLESKKSFLVSFYKTAVSQDEGIWASPGPTSHQPGTKA